VGRISEPICDIGFGPVDDVRVNKNRRYPPEALGKVGDALQIFGEGQGVVASYGMAKPVTRSLIGQPRQVPWRRADADDGQSNRDCVRRSDICAERAATPFPNHVVRRGRRETQRPLGRVMNGSFVEFRVADKRRTRS
jgi:hypothetical protein